VGGKGERVPPLNITVKKLLRSSPGKKRSILKGKDVRIQGKKQRSRQRKKEKGGHTRDARASHPIQGKGNFFELKKKYFSKRRVAHHDAALETQDTFFLSPRRAVERSGRRRQLRAPKRKKKRGAKKKRVSALFYERIRGKGRRSPS